MVSPAVRRSAIFASALWLAGTVAAFSQGSGCTLIPDDRNPSETILRCGDNLVVRAAPGTSYRPVGQGETGLPRALQLDSGALLIDFHGGRAQRNFQILTPHAIAAVRGTRWAVEVKAEVSSTLVLAGVVAVSRPGVRSGIVLGPGQGVDVSAGTDALVVKRWAQPRVRALLARFGE
jgi:hypothetical protein